MSGDQPAGQHPHCNLTWWKDRGNVEPLVYVGANSIHEAHLPKVPLPKSLTLGLVFYSYLSTYTLDAGGVGGHIQTIAMPLTMNQIDLKT